MELGLGLDGFWQITLTEYWALVARHEERERREYIRAGRIAAALYNVNRDPDKHSAPFNEFDIFPGISPESEAESIDASEDYLNTFFQGVVALHSKNGGSN